MIKCVLFDLDGTTIDTNELIIETFDHVLRNECGIEISREAMIPQMGGPLDEQFRYFTKRSDVADLVAAYRAYNITRHDDMVTLFPNVLEVVKSLSEEGFKLGIVTTKMRATSERALRMFGLLPYMESVVTIEDVSHAKPHPEPVLKAMAELGVSPEGTIMVGDSPADIGAGKAAGATAVGVAWSLKSRETLLDCGADHIIEDMTDLYEICGLKRDGR